MLEVLVIDSEELGSTILFCVLIWYCPSVLSSEFAVLRSECGASPAWTWTWYLIMLWGFYFVLLLLMPRRVSNPCVLDSLNWSLLVYGRFEVCLLWRTKFRWMQFFLLNWVSMGLGQLGFVSLHLELNSVRRDTWLILPVVICLSQRLSHACLSTSLSKVKPRMAH